ncbi:DUF262 domain-containing protein [Vibrio alginolyticus]|uniref:DUF262 domain-containing protein n=1 Tax=Vibrio alginolyticus TaxID=663 RepID=UPI001BD490BB|nr:DUF262 domain-containing protein [Vibrio alginolyticus]MBT0090791.1 DUF262 domain-containing protein [Vibrio alginolyticus]
MERGKGLTFFGLFDVVDKIQIPILQRDYAQGRAEEFEVRAQFLSSLHCALTVDDSEQRAPLDLDFVYGNFDEGDEKAFSVLDGQQRLTTLFLLHWFLAVHCSRQSDFTKRFVTEDGRARFTYKTRPSSTEFFDALTSNSLGKPNGKISTQICDSQWFYLSWKQDPTVQSCLRMLDAIQTHFVGEDVDLYERLTNTEAPFITFQFLDLHSFGLSDELYIKMNARGKPLTIFENFKAKLEQAIQSFESPWPKYKLPFKEACVDGYEYFIHKIDTAWADLFWPYRNAVSEDNTFDDELMNFFRLLIAYQSVLDAKDTPEKLTEIRSKLFGSSGRLWPLSLSEYDEYDCINQELIVRLINVLDKISCNGLVDGQIKPYLAEPYYFSESNTFKKVITNTASYDDKLRFFAFYSFLAKSSDLDELAEWMRVVYNLTENTIINTSDEFCKALLGLDRLLKAEDPILLHLQEDIEVTGFVGAQVLEEKIKAYLLLKSAEWRDEILLAEKNTFFNGQIGFLFNFSGVLEFYRENNHCSWDDELDSGYLEKFRHYKLSACAVFDLMATDSSAINYAWERAVLSKGVYFTEKSGHRFNLLSSNDTRNNIPRDHSWRRLLRITVKSTRSEDKQRYVKAVFDDPYFDTENVQTSLEKICSDALENPTIELWQKCFIRYPILFKKCRQGFISNDGTEIILLSESQRNHYHSELYSKVIELRLNKEVEELLPFKYIRYVPVKSRDEYATFNLSGWLYGDNLYSIEVGFYDGHFKVWINAGANSVHSEKLLSILKKHGFKSYTYHESKLINDELDRLDEVIDMILELCSEFKELKDE